jgi:phospholipid/cholesterol/gamma-HCH transport system substrate-binding protein
LDELTGDPNFRQNLRQLVNGLSGLVSSTQQMQQQVQVANTIDSVKAAVSKPNNLIPTPAPTQQAMFHDKSLPVYVINPSPANFGIIDPNVQESPSPSIPKLSQENLLKQLREYGKERETGKEAIELDNFK